MKLLYDISVMVVKHSIRPFMNFFSIYCFLFMRLDYSILPESFEYYLFFTFVNQLAIAMFFISFELSEIFNFFNQILFNSEPTSLPLFQKSLVSKFTWHVNCAIFFWRVRQIILECSSIPSIQSTKNGLLIVTFLHSFVLIKSTNKNYLFVFI